jgi:hypothetical protein
MIKKFDVGDRKPSYCTPLSYTRSLIYVSQDFWLQVFFMNHVPPSPRK